MATTPEALPKTSPQALKPFEPPKENDSSPQKKLEGLKQKVLELLKKHSVSPQLLVDLGEFARATIKDKALYPVFKQAVLQNKVVDEAEMKPGIDYQMLAYFAMIGKVVKDMSKTGQTGAMQ